MKYLKFILAISLFLLCGAAPAEACGPYYPDDPAHIFMFRTCTPALERQWQEGCRFQEYEKEQNCILWQSITASSIPVGDIQEIIYNVRLADLNNMSTGRLADNKFAQWLSAPQHSDDLEYIRIAKEIEEIRKYMVDPWYYAYDGDDEHLRLAELKEMCNTCNSTRHASRYALQLVRLYFAVGDFQSCIDLWENQASRLPQTIVTDMIASYVGGAYSRKGDRDKAIALFTLSQDIGSLISLKAWNGAEKHSPYTDDRVKELEYIFNRFPNSPLLSVKLQRHIRDREAAVYYDYDWEYGGPSEEDLATEASEKKFCTELKNFAQKVIASPECRQKAMWNYTLGYLYYLDGNLGKAAAFLNQAERSETSPFIKDSVKAFRLLINALHAGNSKSYHKQLLKDLEWLDEQMEHDVKLTPEADWQYNNKMNWSVCYWQDVARKVLLGAACPKIKKAGNHLLALQLANYASNRIYQLAPQYQDYIYGDESDDFQIVTLSLDEFRKTSPSRNDLDWQSQFFEWIYDSKADDAARYAHSITNPKSSLDKFLSGRGYVDTDYIYDIVGTLYLREMNYEKAAEWLSKVSPDYQSRTNLAKDGYFKLDPFRYQVNKKQLIADSGNYKLRFAQEMCRLARLMNSKADANQKAEAKIKFAIGLRNSFGKCWYLTEYGHNVYYTKETDDWTAYTSIDRKGFTENPYAQKAYRRVDKLMKQALSEFTDRERAALAQLDMMNYATLMKQYPDTEAASSITTRCDNYHDYALHKR